MVSMVLELVEAQYAPRAKQDLRLIREEKVKLERIEGEIFGMEEAPD